MPAVFTDTWLQRRPDLIRWLLEGVSMREIARRLGVTKSMVSGQIHQLRKRGELPGGVTSGADAPNVRRVWTPEMDHKIRRLREQGYSYRKIAAEMGLVARTVQQHAKDDLGLPADHKVSDGVSRDIYGRARVWTEEEKAEVRRLYEVGFTYRQIAEQVRSTAGRVKILIRSMRHSGILGFRPKLATTRRSASNAPRTRTASDDVPIRKRSARKLVTIAARGADKAKGAPRLKVQHRGSLKDVLASMTAPSKSGVALMDLQGMHCRWPLICDDGEVRYCGQGVTDRPYCAEHAARAFNGKSVPSTDIHIRLKDGALP